LGCFDGKLLDFIQPMPQRYVGFDANWEGGLDLAATRATPEHRFVKAESPAEMHFAEDERFTLAACMETLEHVPPDMVDGYLRKIARHLDGWFFVTVPNEKGAVFLSKWMAKKLLRAGAEPYTLPELINATLGRTERVARREHKGFDWHMLVRQIAIHFEVVRVTGLPMGFLAPSLCLTIGIVAKSKAGGTSA